MEADNATPEKIELQLADAWDAYRGKLNQTGRAGRYDAFRSGFRRGYELARGAENTEHDAK